MSSETEASKGSLPRVLGPWAAFSVVVGSVIGSGIFITPSKIANNVPYIGGIAFVWIVGGLFSMAGALTLAELSAMLPSAGGPYVYLREAFGKLWAFLFGWTEFLVIRTGSMATLAAAFAMNFAILFPAQFGIKQVAWETIAAIAAIITLTTVNVIGTRFGGRVQVVGTALKIGALVAMIVLPFALGKADPKLLTPVSPPTSLIKAEDPGQAASASLSPQPLTTEKAAATQNPSVEPSWNFLNAIKFLLPGIMVAMIAVLWTYDGWVNAASLAEEIKDPGKNIPRALILGMFALIAIYLGMTLVYHLVLPMDTIQHAPGIVSANYMKALLGDWGPTVISVDTMTPKGLSKLSRVLEWGPTLIAVVIMTSTFITLNGNALSGPRAYFAMARDGVFPSGLCKIDPTHKTPANAIIAQAVWAVLLITAASAFLLIEPPAKLASGQSPSIWISAWQTLHAKPLYDVLYTYVIFGGTIFYGLAIVSVFVLRVKRPDLPRPYRTWGYPVTPLLYTLASLGLLGSMLYQSLFESLAGLAIVAVGVPAYWIFSRTNRSESQL
jgi:APA family basic amino acid/polyamine antiporter